MRKYVAIGTLSMLGLAGPALADGFSYNNIEAAYVSSEIGAVDGDGFAVSGSFGFGESVFGFASINDLDFEASPNVTTSAITLGVGFHWGLSPDLDLVTGLSYERLRLKVSGLGSATESGVGVMVGLKGRLGESFEFMPSLKYIDLGDGVNDFTWGIGGRYYFTPAFAAGIDLSDNDDGTTWTVALRYDFGLRE